MEEIINLVDEKGNRIGEIEKMKAHVDGKLHEAFSIFVFNKDGELLLQRRALEKYHSGGLWTNTCCSHPRVGEDINVAVHRRLVEEMGFDSELKRFGSFMYRSDKVGNGLIEHEFDYLFMGETGSMTIVPNPDEVMDYKWIKVGDLKADVLKNPQKYTAWLGIILKSGYL